MNQGKSALLSASFSDAIAQLDSQSDDYVPAVVDQLLTLARGHRASDIHLIPTSSHLLMQWRIDGVLYTVAGFDAELRPRIVARLKVLAGLLTYRTDMPQEGRIAESPERHFDGELRVTTFPTLFGEKAAVRLFADNSKFQELQELRLPEDVEAVLRNCLPATSGVILLTGPSGSGKTTTVYACLRELVKQYGESRSLMTLEDPIEVVVPGVTQSQVRPGIGFDLSTGLRSMMRQDPDVIMVGEIRDPETAEAAFQAALTGHLVLTTFHAGSGVEAVTRLLDMGIEPYLLRSTLQAIICQRLLRQKCAECVQASFNNPDSEDCLHKNDEVATPVTRCPLCGGLGYFGRFVLAELFTPGPPEVARAILDRVDARSLETIATANGMATLRSRADKAVASNLTTREEVFRVLGT